jgi:NADPH:quinone reductase
MRAVQFDRLGGPEVLSLREVPTPEPTPGTVLVRNRVIAVNSEISGSSAASTW